MPKAIPVLRITDEPKAREFYSEFLGFTIGWDHRFGDGFPIYMGLTLGEDIEIHLTEHAGDADPGGACYLQIDDVGTYYNDLKTRDPAFSEEIHDQPWGTRELRIIDPFGNRIKFASSLE